WCSGRLGRRRVGCRRGALTRRPVVLGATTALRSGRRRATSAAARSPRLAKVLEDFGAEAGSGAIGTWQDAGDPTGDAQLLVQFVRGRVGLRRVGERQIEQGVD